MNDPCICCPVQVRGLYAVAFNLLNLRKDPERWQRKIGERLDELQAAVTALTPFIDAHFENADHARSDALVAARDPTLVPALVAALKALRDPAFGNPHYPDETRRVEAMADAAIAKAEA